MNSPPDGRPALGRPAGDHLAPVWPTRPHPAAAAASPAPRSAGAPRVALVWLALAVVYVIWGSTYLAIRLVTESMPAIGSAAMRFAAAGVLLGLILTARRGVGAVRVSRAQLGASGLVGVLLLAGGNGMVVLAESPDLALPSGVAALLIALVPLILVVFRAVAGDRIRMTTIAGVIIGFAGVVMLFLPALGPTGTGRAIPVLGGLVVLIAALSWATGSFATRWLPMPPDPFVASVYQMLAGGLVLAGAALGRGERAPWRAVSIPAVAWISLAYLIVFGSLIAYTAYVWLLHHAPISLTSTYAYVNPVIALALGGLLAGESLSAQVLLAAATVLVGVTLVVSTERPRPPRPDPPG